MSPSAIVALLLLVSPGPDEGFTHGYVGRVSFGVMATGEADAVVFRYSPPGFAPSGGVQARLCLFGFLVGLGLDVQPSGLLPMLEPRVSLGYAFVVSRRVALSPSVRASLWFPLQMGFEGLTVGLEVPVTIYLTSHFFLEPFGYAGVVVSWGISPMFGAGLRVGWTF